jgi:hypothetical protein
VVSSIGFPTVDIISIVRHKTEVTGYMDLFRGPIRLG